MSQITWILQFSLFAKDADVSLSTLLFEMILAVVTIYWECRFQTKWRGFAWRECDTRRSWSLLLRCFPIAWNCSIPSPSWELITMGSSALLSPSVPSEYNHMNQGWASEQSTAEEMKDAWVVVAIVHLIRTEVSIQSEQTQEVILIKL